MLNTGRQMYHWHTGTMTRRSDRPRLPRAGPGRGDQPGRRAPSWAWPTATRCGSPPGAGRILIGVRISDRQAPRPGLHSDALPRGRGQPAHQPALDPYAKIAELQGERGPGRAGAGSRRSVEAAVSQLPAFVLTGPPYSSSLMRALVKEPRPAPAWSCATSPSRLRAQPTCSSGCITPASAAPTCTSGSGTPGPAAGSSRRS